MSSDPARQRAKTSETAQRTTISTSITVLILLLVVFLWYAVDVLLLAFAGILLAIFLRTLSDFLAARTGAPSGLALAIVILVLVGLAVLAVWLVAPSVSHQVDELTDRIPASVRQLESWLGSHRWGEMLLESQINPAALFPTGKDVLARTTGVVSRTLGALFSAVVVLFVALYLAAEPRLYTRGILHLVPCGRRDQAREVLDAVGDALRRWLFGVLIAMSSVGVLTFVGLWLLGVPMAFTLALVAALLDFIPNFGPIIAAVPALLLAVVHGPAKVGYVALLYVGVQTFESYIITPLVQRRAVSLPPVLTILGQVLMGILAGPIGLVLATPLLVAVMVIIQMLYVRETLGDEVAVAGQPEGSDLNGGKGKDE